MAFRRRNAWRFVEIYDRETLYSKQTGHDVNSLHHEGLRQAIFRVLQKSSRRQLLALVDHLAQLATTDEWQSAALW